MSPLEAIRALAEQHAASIAAAAPDDVALVAHAALVEVEVHAEVIGLRPYDAAWTNAVDLVLAAARLRGVDDIPAAAREARRALREREKAKEAAEWARLVAEVRAAFGLDDPAVRR